MMTGVTYEEITGGGLTITTKEGDKLTIAAETIIPATPMSSNIGLAETLKKMIPEVYVIGDCKEPRLIPDAIADGWKIANVI